MQAYALQQALRKMGYEPVTLDIPFDRRSPLRRWAKSRLLALKQIPYDQSKQADRIVLQHTSRFVQQHITLSPPLRSATQLRKYYLLSQLLLVWCVGKHIGKEFIRRLLPQSK